MTKIYTYCLFDTDDTFHGVYSSLSAAYRDAIKLANRGQSKVMLQTEDGWVDPDLSAARRTPPSENPENKIKGVILGK
jgi:hypothetical protein